MLWLTCQQTVIYNFLWINKVLWFRAMLANHCSLIDEVRFAAQHWFNIRVHLFKEKCICGPTAKGHSKDLNQWVASLCFCGVLTSQETMIWCCFCKAVQKMQKTFDSKPTASICARLLCLLLDLQFNKFCSAVQKSWAKTCCFKFWQDDGNRCSDYVQT